MPLGAGALRALLFKLQIADFGFRIEKIENLTREFYTPYSSWQAPLDIFTHSP
jgi:hypothetical protein